jgi:hypothetical protein
VGGRRNGGIYKERTGKEHGKEEGNEERKGRWTACRMGEYENGGEWEEGEDGKKKWVEEGMAVYTKSGQVKSMERKKEMRRGRVVDGRV